MKRARPHPCEAALDGLPPELLVAVSGGVDSVALLEALVRTGHRPVVLHVDHGWRAESRAEAKAVATLARRHDLDFATTRLRSTKKTESAARAARHAFFVRAAKKFGRRDLVLAHHADDQVETFLLQLLRGAGSGAHGMSPLAALHGLVLHRPWLGIWKSDIVAYARAHELTWSDDPTNRDPRHRRNLIRHDLLPALAKLAGPETARQLWRAAEIGRAESEWIDSLCAELAQRTTLPVANLRAAPVGQQRRTILRWLQGRGVTDLAFSDIEAVRGLLNQRDPARINLSRGRFARRRAGSLFIE